MAKRTGDDESGDAEEVQVAEPPRKKPRGGGFHVGGDLNKASGTQVTKLIQNMGGADDNLVDLLLVPEKGKTPLKAHRLIVAMSSPVLLQKICELGFPVGSTKPKLTIEGATDEILSLLKEYIYGGGEAVAHHLRPNIVFRLEMIARRYQMEPLRQTCLNYVRTTKRSKALDLLAHIPKHSDSAAIEELIDYARNHFGNLLSSSHALEKLPQDLVVTLLKGDTLDVPSESVVVDMLVKWVKGPNGPKDPKVVCNVLQTCVRLPRYLAELASAGHARHIKLAETKGIISEALWHGAHQRYQELQHDQWTRPLVDMFLPRLRPATLRVVLNNVPDWLSAENPAGLSMDVQTTSAPLHLFGQDYTLVVTVAKRNTWLPSVLQQQRIDVSAQIATGQNTLSPNLHVTYRLHNLDKPQHDIVMTSQGPHPTILCTLADLKPHEHTSGGYAVIDATISDVSD